MPARALVTGARHDTIICMRAGHTRCQGVVHSRKLIMHPSARSVDAQDLKISPWRLGVCSHPKMLHAVLDPQESGHTVDAGMAFMGVWVFAELSSCLACMSCMSKSRRAHVLEVTWPISCPTAE